MSSKDAQAPDETATPERPIRDTSARGRVAEDLAIEFLQSRGLTLVERNVTLAGAELDVIMATTQGEPTLVFVEVRSRASDQQGHPVESVTASKQAKVRRAATAWLVAAGLWERQAVRFDVVTLTGSLIDASIDWYPDAF